MKRSFLPIGKALQLIVGRNRPKVRKIALKELKWRVFSLGYWFYSLFLIGVGCRIEALINRRFCRNRGCCKVDGGGAVNHTRRVNAHARVTCAPSLGISIFCFHNLHRSSFLDQWLCLSRRDCFLVIFVVKSRPFCCLPIWKSKQRS